MKLLALDTATEGCSAALLQAGKTDELYEELGRGHAERILPMIDELLTRGAIGLAGLDAIAFGRGPGGFTGVRLATSLAQGLAFSAALPLVPVSDLRAVAQLALDEHPEARTVLVCNDARMGEVYWACFERLAQGTPAQIGIEHVTRPELIKLPGEWRRSDVLAGRGVAQYPQISRLLRHAVVSDRLLPRAGAIARLAAGDFATGLKVEPQDAAPVYLRDDVARPG
jgi:tRNA threonylcarbamoyladenosine biosynthesis protein TsaB